MRYTCPACKEVFDTPTAQALHECDGPPVKICPDCHLTKPCECDD